MVKTLVVMLNIFSMNMIYSNAYPIINMNITVSNTNLASSISRSGSTYAWYYYHGIDNNRNSGGSDTVCNPVTYYNITYNCSDQYTTNLLNNISIISMLNDTEILALSQNCSNTATPITVMECHKKDYTLMIILLCTLLGIPAVGIISMGTYIMIQDCEKEQKLNNASITVTVPHTIEDMRSMGLIGMETSCRVLREREEASKNNSILIAEHMEASKNQDDKVVMTMKADVEMEMEIKKNINSADKPLIGDTSNNWV